MNSLALKNWSERQQVLAVILIAGILMTSLWFSLLTPLNRKRNALKEEIELAVNQLASRNYLRGEDDLRRERDEEQRHNRSVHTHWMAMSERLASFADQDELVSADIGVIDFTVKLFEVEQRLLAKSRALGIPMPRSVSGMREEVQSSEDARRLLLQLRAAENLVNLTLDLKINTLRNVEPLAPVQHKLNKKGIVYLEEYPVRADFEGSLGNLFSLFHSVLKPEHALMLKNLRIQALDPHKDLFTVSTVMSSLLFLKDPDEIVPAPRAKRRRSRPTGH
jgi:hypothetical protein